MITTYSRVALAAVLWGASFNLAKPVLEELHPLVAGADRYLIAAAIMLAIACIKGEPPPYIPRRTIYDTTSPKQAERSKR